MTRRRHLCTQFCHRYSVTREKDWIMTRHGGRGDHACTAYVHSRITLYYASKIDLRYCRSLHSCTSCNLGQVDDPCGAIHFGVCDAVSLPPFTQRRVSSSSEHAVPSASLSPGLGSPGCLSSDDDSTIYHSSANFSAPTNRRDNLIPKTRSLTILREGHELAGMHLDHRPSAHQSGLICLHPQRQVIVQGPSIRIGRGASGVGHSGSNLIISSGGAGYGRGGGVAITIQRGHTNISSGGRTAIKIQGQGHEIHIHGRGGQNIRVHPALGGHAGRVIRIQGQQEQHQHPSISAVSPATASTSIDVSNSAAVYSFSLPKSYSSTRQFQPQKPTARVAPEPASPQICTLPQVSTPASTLSPSSALSSSCPDSPTCSQDTPPFPVCSPVSSVSETPASSPLPSPTSTSPVATVQPPVTQPVPSGSNKETEVGNSHVSQTTLSTPKQTSEGLKSRQSGGVRDISSQVNGDGLLHQSSEIHPGSRKLYGKDVDNASQQTHERLQGFNDTSSESPRIFTKTQVDMRDKEIKFKKRVSRPFSSMHIPQFYFPSGKPASGLEVEATLQKVAQVFAGLEGGKAYKQQMGAITKASGLPLFWKILLFRSAGGTNDGYVSYQSLSVLLKKLYQTCYDEASKFMRLVAKPGATVLDFEDFEPLVQDIVETHPGLTFLQDAPEFHSRYVTTVISRVMFCVNRSWTGRITMPELRKSNFLQIVARLEEEDDINQIKDFFSYEHFYVIYCKFWELDKDHDLFIDKNDLSRHNEHALNSRLVDRIFSGAVTRGTDFHEGKMSYKEFVWFLLAEEDKKHPTSIEYWFRCMDLDGDGVISMYEMEYFHEEQMNKMETLGIERLPFEDTVCQMMDMVCPKMEGKITLSDLKACKMTNIFFDTFFNLDKFLDHEQRDPFANAKDPNSELTDTSDWNRYAEIEYDNLVADEGNADIDDGNYEDDFEPEDDEELIREEMLRLADTGPSPRTSGPVHGSEDIYDFSNTSNLGY